MKLKINFLISLFVIFLLLFTNNVVVEAESDPWEGFDHSVCDGEILSEYKCVYESQDKNYKVTVDIKPPAFCDSFSSAGDMASLISVNTEVLDPNGNELYQPDSMISDLYVATKQQLYELIYNFMDGKCDTTLYVIKWWSNSAQKNNFEVLFNDTLKADAEEYYKSDSKYKELSFQLLEFIENESTGNPEDVSYSCEKYAYFYNEISTQYNNISNCQNNCSAYYQQYNESKVLLSEYCRIQLKYLNHGDSCLTECLGLKEELAKVDVNKYGLGQCGFSEKLILYIANIVKWIKYIIPVLVIVLGILDFIKAVSADKDDEMKKAQGKFVKRLIAAALIFIVPFILEFVIDKMGFNANGCGIIDL